DRSATVNMFWDNGNRASDGGYDTAMLRHGEWKMYNESGKLIEIINYKHGKADGVVKIYYPNTTQLALECIYADGDRNGYYKYYFDNGNMHEDGFYMKGSRHGHWKIYTPDGSLEQEGDYKYGEKDGVWIDYRDDKSGETVTYTHGHSDKEERQMREWQEKAEWAKEHQDQFMHPEDYLDNPLEFFQRNSNVDYGKSQNPNTREAGNNAKTNKKK
ncbi:MAG: hypothetical protein HUK20_15715, partial [Fibrobacter sp.]|nr:hypothetical protein [Bacteroidales bacterium]MCF0225713.1 hypothetical protein [Fibrobacter sp.]